MIAHKESEQSILGCMLRSKSSVSTAIDKLQPDDFSEQAHRDIFASMLTLSLHNKPVDLITLDEELTKEGKLLSCGGPEYLVELQRCVPSTSNLDTYIKIVLEKANLRRLQMIAESINRKTVAEELTSDEIIELIEGACSDITTRNQQKDAGWISCGDAVLKAYEEIEKPKEPISTGFSELDSLMCGGLTKGELTIIGARPGKGKSAFMLSVGMNAAERGANIGYFSLEMSAVQIAQRILAATSSVSITRQRLGRDAMEDKDWEYLTDGMSTLTEKGIAERLHIYEAYNLTIERLGNIVRHAVQRGEIDLLIVDYIQLMRTNEKAEKEYERIGKISKGMKQLALALNIPILTAAQVRRQSQEDSKKGGRAPTLDELRGSGDLEQDADNVLLIHSPSSEDDPTIKNIDDSHIGIIRRANAIFAQPFTVEIAKQRQGATGRTWCLFKPSIMRFIDDIQ